MKNFGPPPNKARFPKKGPNSNDLAANDEIYRPPAKEPKIAIP